MENINIKEQVLSIVERHRQLSNKMADSVTKFIELKGNNDSSHEQIIDYIIKCTKSNIEFIENLQKNESF